MKFLIRKDCSEDEFADGIDAFLNLIESYYFSVHRDELDLDEEDDCSGHVLIEFDKESNSLRVLDPISHAKKQQIAGMSEGIGRGSDRQQDGLNINPFQRQRFTLRTGIFCPKNGEAPHR